ncbi:hypothetical protein HDU76_005993 [Blyttiomyces sp. JEL0837]|nr:hypothetical protein HDU76_005993 [Blyttiomyces sp. JEL0837]
MIGHIQTTHVVPESSPQQGTSILQSRLQHIFSKLHLEVQPPTTNAPWGRLGKFRIGIDFPYVADNAENGEEDDEVDEDGVGENGDLSVDGDMYLLAVVNVWVVVVVVAVVHVNYLWRSGSNTDIPLTASPTPSTPTTQLPPTEYLLSFAMRQQMGETVLAFAAVMGHQRIVNYLIRDLHYDPNVTDSWGNNVLHVLAWHGYYSNHREWHSNTKEKSILPQVESLMGKVYDQLASENPRPEIFVEDGKIYDQLASGGDAIFDNPRMPDYGSTEEEREEFENEFMDEDVKAYFEAACDD